VTLVELIEITPLATLIFSPIITPPISLSVAASKKIVPDVVIGPPDKPVLNPTLVTVPVFFVNPHPETVASVTGDAASPQ
jgi:hypothetical protein